MLTTIVLLIILTVYGFWEYRNHRFHLFQIPVRIHVNGTRGKSSVTRLIAAGLRSTGRRVIAKTTGTEPRIILENGRELPIYRLGRPTILEQLMVVRFAWERGSEILVTECMAVQPHLQEISENKIVNATVAVITNARADHLDQMGPTVRDVAEALSKTIPRNGIVFTADATWFPVFESNANKLNSKTVLVDAETISDQDMMGFTYLEHRENVALALKVCEYFNVPRALALVSMKSANPDPGVLQAYNIQFQQKQMLFYNAFAANDRDSTLLIYERLGLQNTMERPVMIIVSNRGDRLQRAQQFGKMMAEDLEARYFFLVGDFTRATQEIAIRRGLSPDCIVDMNGASPEEVFEAVLTRTERECVVLGIGNIGGSGEEIVMYFKNRGEVWLKQQSALA
jgi:poly-gamma-glutamate synthase PgsB/CapB